MAYSEHEMVLAQAACERRTGCEKSPFHYKWTCLSSACGMLTMRTIGVPLASFQTGTDEWKQQGISLLRRNEFIAVRNRESKFGNWKYDSNTCFQA